jgi:hypothetical protein
LTDTNVSWAGKRMHTPAAVHTVKLGIRTVLVAALLIETHLELDLSEGAEVLCGADPAVAIRVVVEEAIESRGKLSSVQMPIA